MICADCNGSGAVKRRFGTIKKRYCRSCFGTGSVCRQQLRQRDRKAARDARVERAVFTASAWTLKTKGKNRGDRRDAVQALRRRNDGRRKAHGVSLLTLPKFRT